MSSSESVQAQLACNRPSVPTLIVYRPSAADAPTNTYLRVGQGPFTVLLVRVAISAQPSSLTEKVQRGEAARLRPSPENCHERKAVRRRRSLSFGSAQPTRTGIPSSLPSTLGPLLHLDSTRSSPRRLSPPRELPDAEPRRARSSLKRALGGRDPDQTPFDRTRRPHASRCCRVRDC